MLLADHLVEGARAHPLGKRRRGAGGGGGGKEIHASESVKSGK
jgi:hypothetical protein